MCTRWMPDWRWDPSLPDIWHIGITVANTLPCKLTVTCDLSNTGIPILWISGNPRTTKWPCFPRTCPISLVPLIRSRTRVFTMDVPSCVLSDYEGNGANKHLRHGQQPEGPAGITGQPTLHPVLGGWFFLCAGSLCNFCTVRSVPTHGLSG